MALRLRDIFDQDLDSVFSYRTPRVVIIRDYKLGCLAMCINLLILIYFIIFVIIITKGYQAEEYAFGSVLTYTSGTGVSRANGEIRVWDAVDIVYPNHDPRSIVLALQVTETIMQTRGVCRDLERPCNSDYDCYQGYSCDDGYCNEPSWCSDYEPVVHNIDGVENFLIWFQGFIEYVLLAPGHDMTTMDDPRPIVYPNDNYNTLMVRDILEHSETNLDSIRETGAVIRVRTDWDCDITWSYGCSPDMDTKRLDTVGDGDPTGFVMMRQYKYIDNGIEYRDLQRIVGIRFVIEARGRAYAITMDSLILNLSSAIALTKITPLIVDFLMLYCLASNFYIERQAYEQEKYLETENVEEGIQYIRVEEESSEEEMQENGEEEEPREEDHFDN